MGDSTLVWAAWSVVACLPLPFLLAFGVMFVVLFEIVRYYKRT